ncbi:nitrate- and nitrite sensing domain-containing protein [Isoptericola sp. NEAU-Y5]|uniref:histidine kinase n=1 Tax=Isoptericola luteus TaxID=2879484 RepID=A0ABS7ZHN7_9MICO|nr:ATP-binding protein [Isoptericola sp. NEAU-Y5]MCA5894535.1 nitrate- and nitrite sensing domain-containing protein [Isoptericola sp. NEAU-Y5]
MPIFVLALTAAWITWGSVEENRRAEQTSALMDSLVLQDEAGTAFAAERALAFMMFEDFPGAREDLVEAQERTDAALDARDEALEALDTSALTTNVQDAVRRTLADRAKIDQLQRFVTSNQINESRATEQYGQLIENALEVPRSVAQSTEDAGLAQRINAYVTLDEAMLSNTLERPLVAAALASAGDLQDDSDDNVDTTTVSRMVAALQDTDDLRTESQERLDLIPGELRVPSYSDELDQMRLQLRFWAVSGIDREVVGSWAELSQDWVDSTQPVRDEVRTMTADYAEDRAGDAQRTALLTGAGAFGIVVVSLLLALLIARRIVQPLRRLTTATADVRDRLPQMVEQMAVPGQAPAIDLVQVPIESSDEIGRLAAAFNEVNETTMVVAREQAALRGSIAEMFVNVARRDQVLLNRQLAFLDELERSEEDPGTLSNLFRLDHLATRMRRNAESLLVLAGIDSGRRVRNPMPVSDVVRTASSEIELYDRVRLNLGVDPHMLGHNALNAAHLIAELLENATMFSEPHTPVEVTTSRDERGVVVVVRDHGLGMSADELADANVKVARTAASDAVGAQRLGLFVVGRLAERLGATVHFATGSSGSGTEVTVAFPAVLFLPDDALPLPQPTDPLASSTQAAVASMTPDPAPSPVQQAPVAQQRPAPVVQQPPAPAPAPVAERFEPQPAQTNAMPTVAPAQDLAPTGTFEHLEPEPPAAVPVDLDMLTDGTTSVGMPRRRRSGPEQPAVERTDTGQIVLPPLATPNLPDVIEDTTIESWRPPADVETSTSSSLPSRRRSEPEPARVEPEPAPAPVLDVEQRTGLFSSFRSMNVLDDPDTESTLQLGAITEDPAALPEEIAPLAPVAQPAPRQPEPSPAPQAFESRSESVVSSVPTAPARQSVVRPVEAAPEADRWYQEQSAPVPAPAPAAPAAPVAFAGEPHQPAQVAWSPTTGSQEPVSEASGELGSLPAFEDLMADLPSRKSTREASNPARKRGLFGRKPSSDDEPDAPQGTSAPSWSSPAASAAPAAPAEVSDWPALRNAGLSAPAPSAPAAPPVDDGSRASTSYGGSVLPLRATGAGADDPLDPNFVPDTVEARSEWMASAVLYEEMSTLLQRGVFQEGNVTSTNDEQTYRPASVANGAAPGLVRRSRTGEPPASTTRFTARIERDPEQLRSRLSAFQSATSRGRDDAGAISASTRPAPTVNDVPGSSPQR